MVGLCPGKAGTPSVVCMVCMVSPWRGCGCLPPPGRPVASGPYSWITHHPDVLCLETTLFLGWPGSLGSREVNATVGGLTLYSLSGSSANARSCKVKIILSRLAVHPTRSNPARRRLTQMLAPNNLLFSCPRVTQGPQEGCKQRPLGTECCQSRNKEGLALGPQPAVGTEVSKVMAGSTPVPFGLNMPLGKAGLSFLFCEMETSPTSLEY